MTTGPSSSLLTALRLLLDSRACVIPQQPSYSLAASVLLQSGDLWLVSDRRKESLSVALGDMALLWILLYIERRCVCWL